MRYPSELDKAQLKFEFRELYKSLGFNEALQVLLELWLSAEIMSEVIVEERAKENL